jgi:hypothetical protein
MSEAGARRLIEPHLWSGEEILWCDQPLTAGPVARAAARKGFYGAAGVAVGVFIAGVYVRGAFWEFDPRTDRILLIASAALAGAVLAFGAVSAWARARRLVHLVAYAISNRRIIMAQGEDVSWVSLRELEDVRLEGVNLVVRRRRTDTEQLWVQHGEQRPALAMADVVAREVTLAALPEPPRVLALLQTLQNRTAS